MSAYQPNQLLTIAKICGEYGVGRTLLYEVINRGDLRAIKVGKRGTRIRREDIDTWVATLPSYRDQPARAEPLPGSKQRTAT